MGITASTRRVADCVRGFRAARTGSVAILAGIAIPVMFIAAGGALDYTNAVTNTHKAQQALDTTVLQLTRRDLDSIDIQEDGVALFNSILARRGLTATPESLQFSIVGKAIRGSAVMDTKTLFLGYVGMTEMKGAISSEAIPPAQRPIEISLVLDVSGSMSKDLNGQPRIERLKTAVNGMFDTLDGSLPDGTDLSAAIVPYSSSVNLGDYPGVLATNSVGGFVAPGGGADIWAAERLIASNGLDYTVNDASPSTRPIPFVTAAEMSAAKPTTRLTALTNNIGDVRTAVDAMVPEGWTAGHIGMAWGIYSLSESWKNVWPQAPKKADDAEKIIVILSDGEFNTTHNIGNTSLSADPDSNPNPNKQKAFKNNNQAESDAYFQNVCDLAETKGIVVYAVALNLDAASEAKLGNCVSNGGKLFKAASADDLSAAFNEIARRLGQRRLTS